MKRAVGAATTARSTARTAARAGSRVASTATYASSASTATARATPAASRHGGNRLASGRRRLAAALVRRRGPAALELQVVELEPHERQARERRVALEERPQLRDLLLDRNVELRRRARAPPLDHGAP